MMSKNKVPEIRFKGFGEEWKKFKIQKLIDDGIIISHLDGNHGELYPRSEEFIKYGIPYVTANDFITGKVNLKNCKCLSLERASLFKKGIAKDGDILFAHNATVGPVALLTTTLEYVILSTTATYFRCDNINLINRYLKSYFNTKHFILQYSKVMAQSTRNQVPITTQRLFYIQLPNKAEQTKIGNYFQQLDKLIEQKEKKHQKLKQFKKAMLDKMFPRNGADTPEIRFKGFSGKWEEKRLNEIISDFIVPMRDKPKELNGDIPWCRIEDFNGMYLSKSKTNQGITKKTIKDMNLKVYPVNTLLVSCSADLGRCAITAEELVTNQTFIGLVPKRNKADTVFLYYVMSNLKQRLNSLSSGTTISYLSRQEFEIFQIEIPEKEEQEKIGNYFQKLDNQIELQQKELEKLKNIKKASLRKMFV